MNIKDYSFRMSNITHFRGEACPDVGPSPKSDTPADYGKLAGMKRGENDEL